MQTYHADYQWQAFVHLHSMLVADSYVSKIVGPRIYQSHISDVQNPVFPCITFVRQGLGGDPTFAEIDYPFLLIDYWGRKGPKEVWQLYSNKDPVTQNPVGVRPLLINPNKNFDFTEVRIDLIKEVFVSGPLYQSWDKTWHLASRYALILAAKPLTT